MTVQLAAPPCMTDDEHAAWLAQNDELPWGQADSVCRDCPAAFAKVARVMGTCTGHFAYERSRSKSRGTSPGEHLSRTEAQRLRRSRERTDGTAKTRGEKMRALWADPEYRAYIMARRAASTKPQGAPAHQKNRSVA